MSTVITGGGFYYSLISVGGKWTWKVITNNVVNSGQYYYVDDINSPFGPLSVVNSPIPADVVSSMADSLSVFQQQLLPNLYLASGSTLSITVTEGDPVTEVGLISFVNTGALGSFLSVGCSPSEIWTIINPTSVLGLNKNQAGSTSVKIDPSDLLSTDSPYSSVTTLSNLSVPLNSVSVTLNVEVLPRPELSLSVSTIEFTYNIASNTSSGPIDVDITNSGPLTSILECYLSKIQNRSPWLSFIPTSLGPVDSGDSETVTFTLSVSGITKISGTYTETVSVYSNNASNSPAILTIELIVT